ncbi:hypothetical protein EHS39_19585 [Ensifer sp. MPMI2T]|nr:hypothetical protein EHS39_19585 [Ensifer sp. MPMI2T]
MSLVRNGRARLALALPRHRQKLRAIKNQEMEDLFEAYALAAGAIESLRNEFPLREELLREYQNLCLDMQAEVIAFLESGPAPDTQPQDE